MRANPNFDTEKTIMELGVGEALISFLDEKGRPNVVQRGMIIAPGSKMGPMDAENQLSIIHQSYFYDKYLTTIDRESAYEKLKKGFTVDTANGQKPPENNSTPNSKNQDEHGGLMEFLNSIIFGRTGSKGRQHDGIVQTVAKSATRQVVNQIGRQITRGILGSFKK